MEKNKDKYYSIEDLDIEKVLNSNQDAIETEKVRIESIIKNLKDRVIKGSVLLEREKEFIYIYLKTTDYEDLNFIKQNNVFQDNIFKELFLTYFHDNWQPPFYKIKKGSLVEVGDREFNKDMQKLIKISKEWLDIIKIENHKDEVLKEVSTEIRAELKELDKEFPRLKRCFKKKEEEYQFRKDKIILQSKYIYINVKRIMEDNLAEDFEIDFLGQKLEFTAYTFVHVLNRHYAEGLKQMKGKTYHYQYFLPTYGG